MDSVIEGPVVESEDVGVIPVTEGDEVAAVAGTEDGKLDTEAKAAEETQVKQAGLWSFYSFSELFVVIQWSHMYYQLPPVFSLTARISTEKFRRNC